MSNEPLGRAGRILSQKDYESLEKRVEMQGEALKALYEALREMARQLDRELKDLKRGRRLGP